MEDCIRKALEQVIDSMKGDTKLYDCYPRTKSRDKNKFTAMGLADLAGNHLFDDYHRLFGITKTEGHMIRQYFQEKSDLSYINELYDTFPRQFEGESINDIKLLGGKQETINSEVPLF